MSLQWHSICQRLGKVQSLLVKIITEKLSQQLINIMAFKAHCLLQNKYVCMLHCFNYSVDRNT